MGWNVLTDPWLDVMSLNAEPQVVSPLEALSRASQIRCIAAASPVDLFAAHRFLLTLLYWKAEVAGGVSAVRASLLSGQTLRLLLDALAAESPSFELFDAKLPFLQDPSASDGESKSVGSLFAEFASKTNIAHFHHGDDGNMRLCLRCATIGMLRVVPWTQSGGAGLSPSLHNAPPIMAIASGSNLATTLGLNLVSLAVSQGHPTWSGHFESSEKDGPIPYLEALTWNPRRIHLGSLKPADTCWRCSCSADTVIGPIVYLKNAETKKRSDEQPFEWRDPAAFYAADEPYTTTKSSREALAATGRDLSPLLNKEAARSALVLDSNPAHKGWLLVIPSTNPANNKTFDHRQLELTSLSPDEIRSMMPVDDPPNTAGTDGWQEPREDYAANADKFVRSAARLLTDADWAALSVATYRDMHDSPAAFDLLCGLLWSLRKKKVRGLPSRNVAWLMLKLMAAVPSSLRTPRLNAMFCPLRSLPKRQIDERRADRPAPSPYPISFPRSNRLESQLRGALDTNMRKRNPEPIDWAGLGDALDQMLD